MRMTLQRAALWAIVLAAAAYLLVAGRGLLLPFVLGIVLWYMIDALAEAFEHPRFGRWSLPRWLALVVAVVIMGGLVWVLGRTIGRNVSAVVAAAPVYERRLQGLLNQAAEGLGIEQAPTIAELFDRISLSDTLSGIATAAASLVSVAGIVLIYAGFLFVEQVRRNGFDAMLLKQPAIAFARKTAHADHAHLHARFVCGAARAQSQTGTHLAGHAENQQVSAEFAHGLLVGFTGPGKEFVQVRFGSENHRLYPIFRNNPCRHSTPDASSTPLGEEPSITPNTPRP